MINRKNYDDILHLPHHISQKHPQMKISDRAAQFAPFAALTGHDEAILETARIVDQKLDLDEYQIMNLNKKLNDIQEHIKEHSTVSITYFQQDHKKTGGAYITIIDQIQKIDEYNHVIIISNHTKIHFEDIYEIDFDI